MGFWAIFGAIGSITSFMYTEVGDSYSVCPDTSGIDGECCGFDYGDATFYFPMSCDDFHTIETVNGVEGLLTCIVGVAGIIGLSCYIACMMLIPAAYSVPALIASVVVLILIGFSHFYMIWSSFFSLGIALLVALLFIANYRLMKDTDPKGERPMFEDEREKRIVGKVMECNQQ